MTFVFVSGRPSLDFAGTRKWRRNIPEEQLTKPSAITSWVLEAGLVDAPIRFTLGQFDDAIVLREAIYQVIANRLFDTELQRSDVTKVNQAAQSEPISLTLKSDGAVQRRATVEQLLSSLARDALDLLDPDLADRIRECNRAECTRLYVDTSRTQNRRWCGMSECGNNSKVTAFRQRQRN